MPEEESVLEEHSGNGHDPDSDEKIREGATIPLDMLRREDGIISLAASSANRNASGVLQKLITTIDKPEDFWQVIKTGNWTSPNRHMIAVDAIMECIELGDDIGLRWVVGTIIAGQAGVNSALVHEALQALTHTSFTTNYQGGLGNAKGTNNARKNSPIT